jgi:hypothetical protein
MTTIELMDDEFAITFTESGGVSLYTPDILSDEDSGDVSVPKMFMYVVVLFFMLNAVDERLFELLDQKIDEFTEEINSMDD